jgi:hypothetical protein
MFTSNSVVYALNSCEPVIIIWMDNHAIMKILKNTKPQKQEKSVSVQLLRLILVLAVSIVLGTGFARAQTDAYSVEVAVTDRSADEQKSAYLVAFRRVLLNNSGDKTLLNRDGIRDGLNNAEDFVTAFTYRTPPPGTVISSDTPITQLVRKTGEATQLMMVTFDRTLVRKLIDTTSGVANEDDQAAPIARQSKSALVWLLIQDAGRDIRISDSEAVNVQARAREIAGAMAIPLVFPTGDEADRSALGIDDMLTMDSEAVLLASERYEPSTILSGSIRRNGSRGWTAQWLRLSGDEKAASGFDSNSLDEALQQGISLLAGAAAADSSYLYGGSAASDTEGLVWVGSVDSLSDYASLIRFFEAVPNVATVYPKEIGETTMVFAILPRAALRDIENETAAQSWIRRTIPSTGGVTGGLAGSADLALELSR